jgi:hypothetical protein
MNSPDGDWAPLAQVDVGGQGAAMSEVIINTLCDQAEAQNHCPTQPFHSEDVESVIHMLVVGFRRALARQHGWNESLNPRESLLGVALGDQAGISADAPAYGAKETA